MDKPTPQVVANRDEPLPLINPKAVQSSTAAASGKDKNGKAAAKQHASSSDNQAPKHAKSSIQDRLLSKFVPLVSAPRSVSSSCHVAVLSLQDLSEDVFRLQASET